MSLSMIISQKFIKITKTYKKTGKNCFLNDLTHCHKKHFVANQLKQVEPPLNEYLVDEESVPSVMEICQVTHL